MPIPIMLNGAPAELPEPMLVADFLKHAGLYGRPLILVLNDRPLTASDAEATTVGAGDRLVAKRPGVVADLTVRAGAD
jgi:sulfur carrier protein ThiS